MIANDSARFRGSSLVWSAVFRATRLLIFGLFGWLWFVAPADTIWSAVSLAAVLILAALVGATWYLSHARAERQSRPVLDVFYAKNAQVKMTNSRGNSYVRPSSYDQ